MLRQIAARRRAEKRSEIDHGDDFAAIAEQAGQKRRRMGNRAELDPGDQLDDPLRRRWRNDLDRPAGSRSSMVESL